MLPIRWKCELARADMKLSEFLSAADFPKVGRKEGQRCESVPSIAWLHRGICGVVRAHATTYGFTWTQHTHTVRRRRHITSVAPRRTGTRPRRAHRGVSSIVSGSSKGCRTGIYEMSSSQHIVPLPCAPQGLPCGICTGIGHHTIREAPGGNTVYPSAFPI